METRDHTADLNSKHLRQAGLRVTTARLSLLRTLQLESRPMTAKMLARHDALQRMDEATLYRNLASLADTGLIRQLDFRQREGYFEIADKGDHHHLVCTRCGKVEELAYCPMTTITEDVRRLSQQFATVEQHSLEFYGTCKACAIQP